MKKALSLMGIHLPTSFKTHCNPLDKHYKVAPAVEKKSGAEVAAGLLLVQNSRPTLSSTEQPQHGLKTYLKSQSGLSSAELYVQIAILRKVSHRNLLNLHSIYEDDVNLYFLFDLNRELILLSDAILAAPPTEEMVAGWVYQALTALEHLHAHGVIHGRIDVNSFLYRPSKDLVYLCGYEGNKLRSWEFVNPTSAPETANSLNIGQAADLYSFGMVIHFFLYGNFPPTPSSSDSDSRSSQSKTSDCSNLALNLISQMLSPQPMLRPTACQALQHPWFSSGSTMDSF